MECNIPEEQDISVHNTFELNYPINSNVGGFSIADSITEMWAE